MVNYCTGTQLLQQRNLSNDWSIIILVPNYCNKAPNINVLEEVNIDLLYSIQCEVCLIVATFIESDPHTDGQACGHQFDRIRQCGIPITCWQVEEQVVISVQYCKNNNYTGIHYFFTWLVPLNANEWMSSRYILVTDEAWRHETHQVFD